VPPGTYYELIRSGGKQIRRSLDVILSLTCTPLPVMLWAKKKRQLTKITPMAKEGKARKAGKMSPGTKIAAQMRAEANKLTDEQRDESMSFAMQVIYGKGKTASHAVRH
jgi:hypothetical protein